MAMLNNQMVIYIYICIYYSYIIIYGYCIYLVIVFIYMNIVEYGDRALLFDYQILH